MGAMEKALSLPELLTCIGRYLHDRPTIVACLCVCKQWRLQFEPLLWRHFHVASSDEFEIPQPSTELMERNAPFIRSLSVHEIAPESHATFYHNCSQLEDLEIILDPALQDFAERWTFMASVIRNLPRLRKITISNLGGEPNHEFYQAIADCPNIIVLETQGYSFQAEDAEVFFRACAPYMRRLSSTQEYFEDVPKLPDGLVFQEMRYLDIREVSGLSFATQLDWVSRCPKLISLRWEDVFYLSATQFSQIIPTACPYLTSLHLWIDIPDEEIALILDAMPRIEKLNMSRSEFGDKSLVALRKHFPWLKDLNLQYCYDFTSELIQEVLCSCPNLQSISGNLLHYEDIMASTDPWVCKGLQMFDVGLTLVNTGQEDALDASYRGSGLPADWLVADKRAANALLFQRLGQLKELQYLSLGVVDDGETDDDDVPIPTAHNSLEFLAELKHIKYFSCKALFDQQRDFEVREAIEWMVKHWPKLETIEARIFQDDGCEPGPDRVAAVALLRERGIILEPYDHQEEDGEYEFDELDYDDEYNGDDLDGYTDMEDDGYDYDEDEDDLEDLAFYMHEHTLD